MNMNISQPTPGTFMMSGPPPVTKSHTKKGTSGIGVVTSPTFIFYSLLIVSIVITVGALVLYDRTRKISNSTFTYGTLAPFPNAYPQVLPPASTVNVPDTLDPYCVSLCSDEVGAMTPCAGVAIQACSTDVDCEAYCTAPDDLPISCQTPSATIAQQQSALENVSNKYCLVTKRACDSTGDGSDLYTCTSNIDCAVCNDLDDSELEESITCQYVAANATISNITADGNDTQTFTVADAGMYCLPKLKLCSYTTGSAVWTSEGWTCRCDKYGDLFGGEDCTTVKACSNDLVSGWSSDKQTLLLNQSAPVTREGYDAIGDPWTVDSEVNPLACHDSKNNVVECGTTGALYNAVCRCDGLAADDYTSFTYDPDTPYTCVHDPCSANGVAGRTVEAASAGNDTAMQLFALMYQFNNSFGTVFALFEKEIDAVAGIEWSIAALVVYPVNGTKVTASDLSNYKVGGSIPYSTKLRDVRFQWEKGANPNKGGRLLAFTKQTQAQGSIAQLKLNNTSWFYAGVVTAGVAFPFISGKTTTTSKVLGIAPLQYTNETGYTGTALPQTISKGTVYPDYATTLGYVLLELKVLDEDGTANYITIDPLESYICTTPSTTSVLNGISLTTNTGPVGLFAFVNVTPILTGNTVKKDLGYMYKMFNHDANSCVCSGKDSSLWNYVAANVATNNGFTYGGHCEQTTIPHSNIVLPAEQNIEACAVASNTASAQTGLLPGYALDEDGVEYDICAPDPCTGEYTDKYYNAPLADRDGTFNAYTGICQCGNASEGWNHRVFTSAECSAMRTTNPVCSACVNACKLDRGSETANQVCPLYWNTDRQCGSKCETNTSGEATCVCSATDGTCIKRNNTCIKIATENQCCNDFYPLSSGDSEYICTAGQQCRQTKVLYTEVTAMGDYYTDSGGRILECHTDGGHECNGNVADCRTDCVSDPT